MEARKSFGSLLDKAFYQNEYTAIKRADKTMAVIVPYTLINALETYNKDLTTKILKAAGKTKLTYDEAMKLALEAQKSVRK